MDWEKVVDDLLRCSVQCQKDSLNYRGLDGNNSMVIGMMAASIILDRVARALQKGMNE